MRIDLHMHTLHIGGELLPLELARRAVILRHEAIAVTDHVDPSNLERTIRENKRAFPMAADMDLEMLVGVELTHIPANRIDDMVSKAKKAGAEIIVVHGETISSQWRGAPTGPRSTIRTSIYWPSRFLTMEDAQAAADNGVVLEITSRTSHCYTNGHVVRMARKVDAKIVVNSDAHAPQDLITEERAIQVAMGAGLTQDEAEICVHRIPKEIVRRVREG
jgi:histidinol phosphatase-like PHP family hydrolase